MGLTVNKGGQKQVEREDTEVLSKWGVSSGNNSKTTLKWKNVFFSSPSTTFFSRSCSSFTLEHNFVANDIIQKSAYWVKLRFPPGNTALLKQSIMEGRRTVGPVGIGCDVSGPVLTRWMDVNVPLQTAAEVMKKKKKTNKKRKVIVVY